MVEEAIKMKRVLIIGSSGMLGTDLCQELGRNYEVIGADITTTKLRGLAGGVHRQTPGVSTQD